MNKFVDWLRAGSEERAEQEYQDWLDTEVYGDFQEERWRDVDFGDADDFTPDGHQLTKVKYTFNRWLTWSEREDFRIFLTGCLAKNLYIEHIFDKKDSSVVTITVSSLLNSRTLTLWVSSFAEGLLNVHPVSAHTIEPRTRV